MAMGARNAFQGITDPTQRDRWLALPFTGCDGIPQTGQAWVRSGILAATVIVPANAGLALEMLSNAITSGIMPAEQTFTDVRSYPALEELALTNARKHHG